MTESSSLVLEILKQEHLLKMSLCEQKDITSTLKHYSQSAISFVEINDLCQEVIDILNKSWAKDSYNSSLIKSLVKTGQLLWDHLFSRPIKERLRPLQGANLIISVDEELINIPWEFLYDGSNFLCLAFNLGRLVRTKRDSARLQYRSFPEVPKMLILADPTSDLKSAYLEGLNIKNQFDRKRNRVHIDFKSSCIDKLYVKKNLGDYDIVHFCGHCEYEPNNTHNTGWVLNDGKFSIEDVIAIGSTLPLPELVFSNACHSAETGQTLLEADYHERNYSIASAFLFSGVRHYIGTTRKIEDSVSLNFAREFYSRLISGESVGQSVKSARLKLIAEYGIEAMHWANYLLYGDPNFILFKRAQQKVRGVAAHELRKSQSVYKKSIIGLLLTAVIIFASFFLYMRLPAMRPNTYLVFLQAEKLFQKGDNQGTVLLCQKMIAKDPGFLRNYLLLANTYARTGDTEKALKAYFDYALFSEKKQDKKSLAQAYTQIGWFYQLEGQYTKAFDFYNKAITLSQESKDKENEAVGLRKLAVWYIDKKDYVRALELLTKSSEINREREKTPVYKYNLACDYFDIGLVFVNKNDFTAARNFYEKSRILFEKLNLKDELSDYHFNLGEIYLFEKQYQKALESYLRGLKIDESRHDKLNLGTDYNMIGELYVEMGKTDEAQVYFNRAVPLLKELNLLPDLAAVYYNLGLLYKNKGDKDKAKQYLIQAQGIYSSFDTASYEEIKNELIGLRN